MEKETALNILASHGYDAINSAYYDDTIEEIIVLYTKDDGSNGRFQATDAWAGYQNLWVVRAVECIANHNFNL